MSHKHNSFESWSGPSELDGKPMGSSWNIRQNADGEWFPVRVPGRRGFPTWHEAWAAARDANEDDCDPSWMS